MQEGYDLDKLSDFEYTNENEYVELSLSIVDDIGHYEITSSKELNTLIVTALLPYTVQF